MAGPYRLAERLPAWLRVPAARAAPHAVLLALALGATVAVGARLSTAFPSQSRPFGWPGIADLDSAVAMVRDELVLAATLPGLLAGVALARGLAPARDGAPAVARDFGVGALVLLLAACAGGLLAAWGADEAPLADYLAFSTAHGLLAVAFCALGLLAAAVARGAAGAAALGVWLFFVALYDNLVQLRAFREVGYHRLVAGDFPAWFYVAQALSPITAYRGLLILWREGMMDYLERAILGGAALPAWMTPAPFAALLVAVWVLAPLGLAVSAWGWRARRARRTGAAGAVAPRNP